ncbi:hypothetical protein [Mailhella sp.]|uniref:hypothetical protein n=1 Tax=Mailhella sp. TaxID=1981029 RepID=UPI00406491A1
MILGIVCYHPLTCEPDMDEKKERAELIQEENAPAPEAMPAELPTEAAPEAALLDNDSADPAENASAEEPVDAPDEAADETAGEENTAGEDAPHEEDAQAEGEAESDREEEEASKDDLEAPLVMPLPVDGAADAPTEAPAAPALPAVPAGPAEKLFNGLSYLGLPVLLIFAAAMSFLEVWQVRDLWFSDEVRLADAFMNVRGGDWLVLTMNGLPYPDKPPLYFWFMDALTRIPGVSVPMAIFLAVAASHALFIGSIWALARGTGFDRRVAFASGLVALSCVYISGAACYPRMDLLFAALVTLGMTCLYRGWIKSFAPFWLAAGWLLMAAATLTKSPLGIAFAVVASVFFLFWRCTPGRLNSRDGLPGFFLMLVALAVWLGALYLGGHIDYLRAMIGEQLAGRVLEGGHHGQMWWYYLAALPVIWVPWILLPLFVNWLSALRGIPAAVKARKTDGGSSWLWIWLVTGVAMLSCVQAKMAVYALPLLAPLAVLTARSLLRLTPGRSRCFFGLSAAILAVAGLALVAVDVFPFVRGYLPAEWLAYVPAVALPWLEALNGTMYMGAVLIVTAVVLLSLTRLALPGGSLLVTAFGMMLLLQPYHWFVAPSMTPLLSPRAQAAVMAEKMQEGFVPAALGVYPGAYAWHLNDASGIKGLRHAVPDLADEAALHAWLTRNPKATVAMPKAVWEGLAAKPAGASVLLTQWMVHKPYVVVAIESPAVAPAEEKAAPAPAVPDTKPKPVAETAPAAPAAPTDTASPAPEVGADTPAQPAEPQPEAPAAPVDVQPAAPATPAEPKA